jgi:hypothetical protein
MDRHDLKEMNAQITKLERELDEALDELPDAFGRGHGTLASKIAAYREFANRQISEVAGLTERADRESKLAVLLATKLFEFDKGDFHSSLTWNGKAWQIGTTAERWEE